MDRKLDKEKLIIVSAKPEDADFIAWIVAQGMHMDDVPSFLKTVGARDDTLYSWRHSRLLQYDGKLAGGLISYDGATHEEGRRNTWVCLTEGCSVRVRCQRRRQVNTTLTPWQSSRSFGGMACGGCCLTMQ